jgi:hypothetical protein
MQTTNLIPARKLNDKSYEIPSLTFFRADEYEDGIVSIYCLSNEQRVYATEQLDALNIPYENKVMLGLK